MSQLSESTDFQSPARMRALPWATAFLTIVAIAALGGGAMALDAAGDFVRPAAPAAVQPGSRLDDYGLRHPATTSVQPGSRLDDYGLRHPAP